MVLPTMDFLLDMFEEGVEKYRHYKYMSICIDAGWKKLTEYYRKADRAPAYIAAIVLDPTKKGLIFGIRNQNGEPVQSKVSKHSGNSLIALLQAWYRELI